ncbi:Piso0_002902 [Millerozyma farinosa CBS 7064]|uniref:Geranylgeranyl transferase type-2 subunit beta n=1 Tax=Pichia sorbitophila (strain ATCC MYA-4447 / BCRC 22081 / CBS 7064 / NBRC 10061 / NRRL Y-12695) TaxID=559304 RepID=G8YGM4_PICSO|nr:Piso0_002902 [Millerozyma farinosa CBS 7064]CCE80576.1 Piso0_002902 [Millerozyma farinosa CBS 7064]
MEEVNKQDTPAQKSLDKMKHVEFVQSLDSKVSRQSYEYWISEHLRMNGLYWGLTALATMDKLDALPSSEVIAFVMSCWNENTGGFGAFPQHDAHILSTLSALQILILYDRLESLGDERKNKVKNFILGLQLPNGAFQGDSFGEVDTRFVYTAIQSLALLGELSKEVIDRATDFILKCTNFDGAFGRAPGAESHAAQVFTSLATLAIANNLHLIDQSKLGSWLSERQVLPSGGLNGRPEKLPDVCYSWWVLSSLALIDKIHWINSEYLESFILSCQDLESGGFSDRSGNQPDVFHTCFAITGLSLIQGKKHGLKAIDPVYCLPSEISANIKKWPVDYS